MSRVAALLLKKLQNALTEEQRVDLENWLSVQPAENRAYYTNLTEWQTIESSLQKMYQIDETAALDEMKLRLSVDETTARPAIVRGMKRYWVAASAVLVLFGVYWWETGGADRVSGPQITQGPNNDLPPGGMQATLELADGSVILLDSVAEGRVAQQQETFIEKEDEGVIRYNQLNKLDSTPVQYNKIVTPNGGQYQVVLADGSKVWLNSASSIRFPTAFPGSERVVEVTGEAYFEVAANAAKSFTVKVVGSHPMSVDVLGTSFNINAYSDEGATIATLVTGKVRVNSNEDKNILEPGQEAVLRTGGDVLVKSADMDQALAWTRGLFYLQSADIHQIMRQIARWYDVEVVYKEEVQQKFVGKIPRNMNLSEVLQVLESTGWVRFDVSGKTVTVTNARKK